MKNDLRDPAEFKPTITGHGHITLQENVGNGFPDRIKRSGLASVVHGLAKPLLSLLLRTALDWPKAVDCHRLDAAELENGTFHQVMPRHAIDQAVIPWWRIHGHEKMG